MGERLSPSALRHRQTKPVPQGVVTISSATDDQATGNTFCLPSAHSLHPYLYPLHPSTSTCIPTPFHSYLYNLSPPPPFHLYLFLLFPPSFYFYLYPSISLTLIFNFNISPFLHSFLSSSGLSLSPAVLSPSFLPSFLPCHPSSLSFS